MAYDRAATQKFRNQRLQFVENNFILVRGQGTLAKTVTGKNGMPPRNKFCEGAIGAHAHNSSTMAIINADLKTVTHIQHRNPPTVYLGLEKIADHEYVGHVQNNQDTDHSLEVLFLPAAVNQIVGIQLPNAGGSNIVMTDPLSGCTIFTSTLAGNSWMFHANASAVAAGGVDGGRIYMRNLWREFLQGTAHVLNVYFDRPYYEGQINAWTQEWKQAKINLGRNAATVQTTLKNVSIYGFRTGGNWNFYWQKAMGLSSERTGVKKVFRGKHSNKFKIAVEPLPVAPNPLPNP